ncbi:hypothetical protein C8R44DRAFT_98931 [Mycena epipterygia]|nr:hypothetical protein C8R44DRAFT_98931 [Mycena epipterygia]
MPPKGSGRAAKRLKALSEAEDTKDASNAESTLIGLPLDIMLRILKFTSPAELLALHDVNKGFRSTLDSGKRATLIWVNSREYHDIPKPFEDFDECAWARFIFGRICMECEENESRVPDFGLMMRLCTDCRSENLCQELDFSVESDEEDFMGPIVEFDDTYPHSKWYLSRDELWAPNYSSCSDINWWAPYCWDMVSIERNTRRNVKGANKVLKKLTEKGQRRLEHSIICDEWRDGVEAEERQAKQEILTKRFKELGYQDPELDGLNDRKMLSQIDLPMTEDAWTVIRETLEDPIRDKRGARLVKDHPDIMEGRQILAREAYMAYASTVLPKEATYLPTLVDLHTNPKIRAICEREPDVDITISDFSVLPSIVADWVSNKQAKLTHIANSAEPEKTSDRFNLAVTIFRCKKDHENVGRPAIFGGDEAMRHIGETCDPELDMPLSRVASDLVALLGLDPDTASVADMDRRNVRFRCYGEFNYKACDKASHRVQVFTWRGCITHAIDAHNYGRKESWRSGTTYNKDGKAKFAIIPADPAVQAHGSFKDLPKTDSTSWVCGHCTRYTCQPETFQAITVHVNTVHGKSQVDASDVLLAPGVLSISKSCYSVQHGGSVAVQTRSSTAPGPRCLRCVGSRSSRKFKGESSVRDHLRSMHGIMNGVHGVDYGD